LLLPIPEPPSGRDVVLALGRSDPSLNEEQALSLMPASIPTEITGVDETIALIIDDGRLI
jgi:hypothetical protein